jgi:ABC-type glutathione transport system ATPase component
MSTDDKERIRQARVSGAVKGLGIHETGLSFRRTLSKGTLDSQTKVGSVQVKKCAAHKSSFARRFKLCQDRVGHNHENSNLTLLHPMKLNIPEGSITAIVGCSSSGKSTLLKFMAGCLDNNVEWEGAGKQYNEILLEILLEIVIRCDYGILLSSFHYSFIILYYAQ